MSEEAQGGMNREADLQETNRARRLPLQAQSSSFRALVTFVKESRTFVIVTVSILTLYVQIMASMTKNWESTREIGFAEPGYCDSVSASYGVGEYLIHQIDEAKPLCYRSGKPYQICLSQELLDDCNDSLDSIDTGDSIQEFTSLFNRANRNYFPYATFTNAIAFVSLLLTLLYETNEQHFVTAADGSFSMVDKRFIFRLNHLICMALIIILIISASYQLFYYEESCSSLYKDQDDYPAYCRTITSCGMTIASVIRPTDFVAKNYRTLNLTFAILLIITTIFRCLTQQIDSRIGQILPQVLDDTDEEDLNAQLAAIAHNRNVRIRLELDLALLQNAARRGTTSSAVVTNVRQIRHPNWKEYTTEEHERQYGRGNELECPICLSAIQLRPIPTSSTRNHNQSNHSLAAMITGTGNGAGGGGNGTVTARSNQSRARTSFSFLSTVEDTFSLTPTAGAASARSDARDANDRYVIDDDGDEGREGVMNTIPSASSSAIQLRKIVKAQCNHIFHEYCIQEWFRNHDTCPVCRSSLHRPNSTE